MTHPVITQRSMPNQNPTRESANRKPDTGGRQNRMRGGKTGRYHVLPLSGINVPSGRCSHVHWIEVLLSPMRPAVPPRSPRATPLHLAVSAVQRGAGGS